MVDLFKIIGPAVREMTIDADETRVFTSGHGPKLLTKCPNLQSLHFTEYIVTPNFQGPWGDLRELKSLEFSRGFFTDTEVSEVLNRCTQKLESLSLRMVHMDGSVLIQTPVSLRTLCFEYVKDLELSHILNYLRRNPNLIEFDLCAYDQLLQLSNCCEHLQSVQILRLDISPMFDYEELAKLPNLVSLDIKINDTDFARYPDAIHNTNNQQTLKKLRLHLHCLYVNLALSSSLKKFRHLTSLHLHIGSNVYDASSMVHHLDEIPNLHTLYITGDTECFRNMRFGHLKNVKKIKVKQRTYSRH